MIALVAGFVRWPGLFSSERLALAVNGVVAVVHLQHPTKRVKTVDYDQRLT